MPSFHKWCSSTRVLTLVRWASSRRCGGRVSARWFHPSTSGSSSCAVPICKVNDIMVRPTPFNTDTWQEHSMTQMLDIWLYLTVHILTEPEHHLLWRRRHSRQLHHRDITLTLATIWTQSGSFLFSLLCSAYDSPYTESNIHWLWCQSTRSGLWRIVN